MKQLRPLCHCVILLAAWALTLQGAQLPEPELRVESPRGDAGVEFDRRTGIGTVTNGVVVKYGDTVLTADTAAVNQHTFEVRAAGHVTLMRGGSVWRSESVTYNLKTRE